MPRMRAVSSRVSRNPFSRLKFTHTTRFRSRGGGPPALGPRLNNGAPPPSRLAESPAVHHAAVEVEPFARLFVRERVVGAELARGDEAGDETGLLRVDQGVGAAMPAPPPALDEAEQMDQERHVAHVVDDVLEPVPACTIFASSIGATGL